MQGYVLNTTPEGDASYVVDHGTGTTRIFTLSSMTFARQQRVNYEIDGSGNPTSVRACISSDGNPIFDVPLPQRNQY